MEIEEVAVEVVMLKPWYKLITVEPTMFLYILAFMITNVIEQSFYTFQTCRVDHNYEDEICHNITEFQDINIEVQKTVSTFHQWNGIAGHVVPLFLAFFFGAYSDKRGRKSIILAGLIGKLLFSFMITINTMFYWPVNYVIYTATIPSALTGADLTIFAGCFAYMSDITSTKNRTIRVTILDAAYLSAMPIGVALGNFLFTQVVGRSYTAMFAINTSLMILATVYTYINLDWQTSPEQQSLKQAGVTNPVKDFLDWRNIATSVHTLTKPRPNNRRLFMWILMVAMCFYVFQRDERQVMYMYTSAVIEWDMTTYSYFRTYQNILYALATIVGVHVLSECVGCRDTIVVMIGAACHVTGHLMYANATSKNWFYYGATAGGLGACVAPLIRAMLSKVVPLEYGVAFAFLSVMENAVAMFTSVIYSQLYKATLDTDHVNAIFYLTISTQVVVFICALTMDLLAKGKKFEVIFGQNNGASRDYDT